MTPFYDRQTGISGEVPDVPSARRELEKPRKELGGLQKEAERRTYRDTRKHLKDARTLTKPLKLPILPIAHLWSKLPIFPVFTVTPYGSYPILLVS